MMDFLIAILIRTSITITRRNSNAAICRLGDGFRSDGIYRLGLLGRFAAFFAFARPARPDVEAAARVSLDFPRAPDPFAFAKAPVENIVLAEIALGPVALEIRGIIAAFDEKWADVIRAVAVQGAICKRELKFHSMTVTWPVVVEPSPGSGRKESVAHRLNEG